MINKSKKVSSVSLFSNNSDSSDIDTMCFHQGVLIDEIKQIATTKKALWSLEDKKYTFLASPFVTKEWIKRAIESCYNVRVIKVNTSNLPTKKKRVGKFIGSKAKLKKVIVTLNPDDEIPLFSDI
jgi:large subunit ribosomal protein L23|tara:strand:- start:119 stop:493 length:375 start_codon:yes stop_codon:yes gene_type:complete